VGTSEANRQKVALVTGSSSGIGFETALLLARNGFHTCASMRNLEKSKIITEIANREKLPLQVVQLGVNDDMSVKNAIYKIENEQGKINVVVNNAGYLLIGPLEELSIEEFKEQFEANFFGAIRVIKEVLPIMRRQKAGTIINVSSIAGRIGLPLNSPYVSSKFALEGLSESISYEIEQFGIKVVLIEPGVIKTNIASNFKTGKNVTVGAGTTTINNEHNSPYAELTQHRIAALRPRFEAGLDPIEVAKVILKAAISENPHSRYLVGDDALKLMNMRKNASDENFRKLIMENILLK
jgi:NAD(P)-dependent dehydrogenase (short-subunit alcohol dehydrogenase family)